MLLHCLFVSEFSQGEQGWASGFWVISMCVWAICLYWGLARGTGLGVRFLDDFGELLGSLLELGFSRGDRARLVVFG